MSQQILMDLSVQTLASGENNDHLFFVPVYTILEAHKSIESNIRYAQLGQISIKCLGMSADIDSERLSLEEVSTLLKDMCQDIIINKCISFEYLISRPMGRRCEICLNF